MTNDFANLASSVLVDFIGARKAQIAKLEEDLAKAQEALKDRGEGSYPGSSYDATVFVQHRSRLDLEAVRAKLTKQFLRAHTSHSSVVVIKVTAKQLKIAA